MEIIKDLGLKRHGTRNRRFILVKCDVCGAEEEIRSDSKTLLATSCRNCKGFIQVTKNKVTDTNSFVIKANEVHNSLYTYTNTIYSKARTHCLVTCKYHGDFSITPNNHLKGKGCPLCALSKRGWNRSLYTNTPTSIYYAIVNNRYFKIGISKQGERHRYYRDRQYGNTVKILLEMWFFDGSIAYDLEKEMLLLLKDYKTTEPVLVHGGNSELHTINVLPILINKIKELNEIN